MSQGLYFDYHIPLQIAQMIQELVGTKNFDPSAPPTPVDTAPRQWLSQPRLSQDPTTEVITVRFKQPLSIASVSLEITRVSCRVELWYQDRENNWRPVYDQERVPLAITLSATNAAQTWFTYSAQTYPIIAKAFQIRATRVYDPALPLAPYSIGIRNTLIKRNVWSRSQGTQAFEPSQDVLGNVLTRYVKDWAPSQAIDGNSSTYWQSGPQPDPNAVVSMYLDMRTKTGAAQIVDTLFIDPVYAGTHMNLYYSTDDTVTALRTNPITIVPDADTNDTWTNQTGRFDNAAHRSLYRFPFSRGPLVNQDAWVGLSWTPDFATTSTPSLNPTLLHVVPGYTPATDESSPTTPPVVATYTTGLYAPTLFFDAGSLKFTLQFYDGTSTFTFTTGVAAFAAGQELRILAGWTYEGAAPTVHIKVVDSTGALIASLDNTTASTLPSSVTFDGEVSISDYRGLLRAMVWKLENYTSSQTAFLQNPTFYCAPEPVLPDAQGNLPSTTLDNAIYSVDWTSQEHGIGGSDVSIYSGKEWTPIWQNYTVQRGNLFFPQPVAVKYLKLEFTNLLQQPYPVYESGIQTQYQVFPITVQQQSALNISATGSLSVNANGGLSSTGSLSVNGQTVNWLDPQSILKAAATIFSPNSNAVTVTTGPGYVTNSLPNTASAPLNQDFDSEMAALAVYPRPNQDSTVLAQTSYYQQIANTVLTDLPALSSINWSDLASYVPSALNLPPCPQSTPPVQGNDYWVFPGNLLKIPAQIMAALSNTSVVLSGRLASNNRTRFTTTSVHRYDIKTLTRDAAVAYFAGVREVVPMVTSYINNADYDQWTFSQYDVVNQWTPSNVTVYPTGVVGAITDTTSLVGDYGTTYGNSGTPSGTYGVPGSTTMGTLFKSFTTTSTFSQVHADFMDSGLLLSDPMWASGTSDQLAPGAQIIPNTLPAGMWDDSFAEWSDSTVDWGAALGFASVTVDASRSYQGKRVLKISRDGTGQAGVSIQQSTNYINNALYRLGCVIYKPVANNNTVTLQLVHNVDGSILAQAQVPVVAGQWFEWQSSFFTDATDNNSYTLKLLLDGDATEDIYVSDLYSQIAGVRYFLQLGSGPVQEVTALAYEKSANAVSQTPVTSCAVTVEIVSPNAYAFGMTLTPSYDR